VVVDRTGKVLFSRGAADELVYYRSAAKPLQALAALLKGLDTEFSLSSEQVAILCGSHGGEPRHIEVLQGLLRKLSIDIDELYCEPSLPLNAFAVEALLRAGGQRTRLYHNCSGKHIAMIALSRLMGHDARGYQEQRHPVQVWIRGVLGTMCGIPAADIVLGCDGCGVPVHAVPLLAMAASYQRLAAAVSLPEGYERACRVISASMAAHPFLIGGEGRFDSQLMASCAVIAKSGAEGVFCAGARSGEWGMAIKIHDGSQRAMGCVVGRAMELAGFPSDCIHPRLRGPVIANQAGEMIGGMTAAF